MANCDPSALIASGKTFQALSEGGLLLVESELCLEWAGGTPSVNTLLSDGKDFQRLSPRDLSICQAQLLCNIAGGA